MEKLATLNGEFVLKADKKWKRIDLIDSKGQMEADLTGEYPSKLYENKATLTIPELRRTPPAFANWQLKITLCFLIVQRNGKYRLLGSEMYDTEVKPKLSTGEGYSGGGTVIEITSRDISPAPFYAGKVEVDEGNISGANDEVTTAVASGSQWIKHSHRTSPTG